MIDPDYLYLLITSYVYYNPKVTVNSPTDIKNIVTNAISNYNSNNLINFDTTFKLSRLEAAINDSDKSISSNETYVSLRKNINPQLNTDSYIDIDFRNEITPGSFSSTVFISNGQNYQYTDFNPSNITIVPVQSTNGQVNAVNKSKNVYLKNISKTETYSVAGQIDYATGKIALNKITVNGFVDSSSIQFFATPNNLDIITKGNDLIQVDLQNLSIQVNPI
jgi:hypothetical protein